MYEKGKYIVGEINCAGMLVLGAVCFPETIAHTELAPLFADGELRSAGFFSLTKDNKVEVFGDSKGLKLSPIENDVIQIQKTLGLYKK